VPLDISFLYEVMKEEGVHEGCIEQIDRLFRDRLFVGGEIPTDEEGRIRMDDWELRDDIQERVARLWAEVTTETLPEKGDLEGYRKEFFNLFGFDVPGIDYNADVEEVVEVPGLVE